MQTHPFLRGSQDASNASHTPGIGWESGEEVALVWVRLGVYRAFTNERLWRLQSRIALTLKSALFEVATDIVGLELTMLRRGHLLQF